MRDPSGIGHSGGETGLRAWAQWWGRGHRALTGCPGSPSSPRSPLAPSWPCRDEARPEGAPDLVGITPPNCQSSHPSTCPTITPVPTPMPIGHTEPLPSPGKTHPRATFSRRARVTRKANRTLIQRETKGQGHSPLSPPRANTDPHGHMPHSPSLQAVPTCTT